jgi:hypothetical protein
MMARTPVKAVLDDIVDRGQAQRDKASAALEEALAVGRRGTEALTQMIRREVERQLRALGLRPARKSTAKKTSAKKAVAKQTAAKKSAARKSTATAKKTAAKKSPAKKTAAKKTAAKKSPVKQTAAKKSTR